MVRILCAAFAAFLFYMVPISALAQSSEPVFYADDAIRIPWPAELERTPCSPELQAKAGISCVQVGTDGSLGAVFLTLNEGYALGSEQSLEQHLKSSEEALTGIPNIHVMQSRVLKPEPMLGLMEILRKDGGLPGIAALSEPPVRQTAFLVPTGNRLAQVFIYLPLEGEEASKIYQTLFDTMVAGIAVYEKPIVPVERTKEQGSVLQILPKALMLGGAVALIGIFIIRLRRRRTV
jgi:hypothetical protein